MIIFKILRILMAIAGATYLLFRAHERLGIASNVPAIHWVGVAAMIVFVSWFLGFAWPAPSPAPVRRRKL